MAILMHSIKCSLFATFLIGCIPVQPPSDEERLQWYRSRNDVYIRYRIADISSPNGWRELKIPQMYMNGKWVEISEPIRLKSTDKFYKRWENGKWVDCVPVPVPPQPMPSQEPTDNKTDTTKPSEQK